MKRKTVAFIAGAALLAAASLVISQGTTPTIRGGLQGLRPGQLRRLGQIRLADRLTAFGSDAKTMVGAGRNFVSILDDTGKATKRLPTNVADPTVAPMGDGSVLVGDKANRILIGLNIADGKSTPLMKLSEIKDPSPDQMPSGQMIEDGKFSAVGFDGKNYLVALEAGFSSMIFKVDPNTKSIVERGFAGCPDPSAMAFHDGQVLLLSDEGSQITRFSQRLEKAQDRIELPSKGNLGIGVKGGEIRALPVGGQQIERIQVSPTLISSASLVRVLDRVRITASAAGLIAAAQAAVPKRYAVLICGDLAENFSGECFWNDTVWMFKTLIANGYNRDDIIVLYGDGADYMSSNPYYQYRVGGVTKKVTNFAATKANVNMVFDGLKTGNASKGIPKMDDNDTLFLWTFDHGGRGTNPSTGQEDSTLGLRGGSMWAKDFAAKANAIPYKSRVVFMQQCYSGGFIPLMQNTKTYISTACRATEVARPADNKTKSGATTVENEVFGGKTFSHGEFNYHITTALNRLKPTPPGGSVNADLIPSPDGFISAFEMHLRNVGQESRPEVPQAGGSAAVGMNTRFKK